MPLVGFRPTKARLIIEDSNDTVLVMKVVVADSESVEFATGGKLDALTGVLRIRERKEGETSRNGSHSVGSLVYIAESGDGDDGNPAKYQINIAMSPEKFKALLRVAVTGCCRRSSLSTPASGSPRPRRAASRTGRARAAAPRYGIRNRIARCRSPSSR